jgi:heme exporter protein D
MGGYGLYVWGSYAVAACLIAVEIVMLVQRRRNALKIAGIPASGDTP